MLQSMTGFGKAVVELDDKKVRIEIRSLNSKNLDVVFRIPSIYREKESEIRQTISTALQRGKITVYINLEAQAEGFTRINEQAVKSYITQLKGIHTADNYLEIAMRLPDAIRNMEEELSENEWNAVRAGLGEAIEKLVAFRTEEGSILQTDFIRRIATIRQLLTKVQEINPERIKGVKERLHKALDELQVQVDENRFEQELIFYLERLDITEEQVRLTKHLNHFDEVLKEPNSHGKKLGFIAQEIGREINTIGSKANFAPMQKTVVEMKDELEKIKEQLLNVL